MGCAKLNWGKLGPVENLCLENGALLVKLDNVLKRCKCNNATTTFFLKKNDDYSRQTH